MRLSPLGVPQLRPALYVPRKSHSTLLTNEIYNEALGCDELGTWSLGEGRRW
jgi:hypothetical protein